METERWKKLARQDIKLTFNLDLPVGMVKIKLTVFCQREKWKNFNGMGKFVSKQNLNHFVHESSEHKKQ